MAGRSPGLMLVAVASRVALRTRGSPQGKGERSGDGQRKTYHESLDVRRSRPRGGDVPWEDQEAGRLAGRR